MTPQTATATEPVEVLVDDDVLDLRTHTKAVIGILGLGYVGLPTALAFSSYGHPVIGIDVSSIRLDAIREGTVDLLPTDHRRLAAALDNPTFELAANAAELARADAVIICVPTPIDAHLVPDLTYLKSACQAAAAAARPGQSLILTSTTYVGTTRDLCVAPLVRRGLEPGRDVHVAFSPERIDPGQADHVQDRTPRVVGGVTTGCTRSVARLLGSIAPRIHCVSSPEAAEMTKLVENTFRAVNIAFANEMADASRALGLDVTEVIDAAATKPFGFMKFDPGAGVGGHCIPCDPHYLLWQLQAKRVTSPVVSQAMTAIATRPSRIVDRAAELLSDAGRGLGHARALVVGVSYKPGVADVREAPALEVIEQLRARGCDVDYHDPHVPQLRLHDGTVSTSVPAPVDASGYDLAVLVTLHPGRDYRWVAGFPRVLDATYRFEHASHRVLP